MKYQSCSIKKLDKIYLGQKVRLTKGKGTFEFINVPLTDVKIEKYNTIGFELSHEKWDRSIHVSFDQLPLTKLTIDKGIIKDEITFVENIVFHRTEFIRTADPEYINMIEQEKALEELKNNSIISINQAIPGEIYKGAQCKEGTEMIFLGNFYSKRVVRVEQIERGGAFGRYISYFNYILEKNSPKKAFFAIKYNDTLTIEEEKEIEQYIEQRDLDWPARHKITKEFTQKFLNLNKKPRYKIISFPITSKKIKELILTNKRNYIFENIEKNRMDIINFSNKNDYNWYNRLGDKELIEYKNEYKVDPNDYLIINKEYEKFKINYLQKSKKDINKNAYYFLLNRLVNKVEPNKLVDKYNDNTYRSKKEEINFLNLN